MNVTVVDILYLQSRINALMVHPWLSNPKYKAYPSINHFPQQHIFSDINFSLGQHHKLFSLFCPCKLFHSEKTMEHKLD